MKIPRDEGTFVPFVVCPYDGKFGRMIFAVASGGLLFSLCMSNVGGFDFSLLFANNTLIFCGANPNPLHCLFVCFEATLGLKINWLSQNRFLWKC